MFQSGAQPTTIGSLSVDLCKYFAKENRTAQLLVAGCLDPTPGSLTVTKQSAEGFIGPLSSAAQPPSRSSQDAEYFVRTTMTTIGGLRCQS